MQAMASAATAAGGDEDGIGIEKRESGSESQWTSQGFVRAPTPAVRLSDRPNRCCSKPVPDVFVAGCWVLMLGAGLQAYYYSTSDSAADRLGRPPDKQQAGD